MVEIKESKCEKLWRQHGSDVNSWLSEWTATRPMTKQCNVADSDGDVRARPAAALLCPCPVACQVTWYDLANNWLGAVTDYQLVQITCQLLAVIRVMSIYYSKSVSGQGSSDSTTPIAGKWPTSMIILAWFCKQAILYFGLLYTFFYLF